MAKSFCERLQASRGKRSRAKGFNPVHGSRRLPRVAGSPRRAPFSSTNSRTFARNRENIRVTLSDVLWRTSRLIRIRLSSTSLSSQIKRDSELHSRIVCRSMQASKRVIGITSSEARLDEAGTKAGAALRLLELAGVPGHLVLDLDVRSARGRPGCETFKDRF